MVLCEPPAEGESHVSDMSASAPTPKARVMT